MVAGGHAPVMAPGAERPTPEDCAGGCGCKQRFEDIENRLRTLQRELAGRSVAPRAASHRFVSPALEPMTVAPEAQTAGFSVIAPAQQGRSRLTGNAGAGDDGRRITGPINLARGLVTGTPEFRGREALPSAMAITPVAVDGEGAPEAAPPVAGAWRVTGDDWSRNDRVTGTEGRSAQGRNPTQRGVARTCVMSAAGNRERPLAVPVPEGQVTGSSGHSLKGSIVTYSGGARG